MIASVLDDVDRNFLAGKTRVETGLLHQGGDTGLQEASLGISITFTAAISKRLALCFECAQSLAVFCRVKRHLLVVTSTTVVTNNNGWA